MPVPIAAIIGALATAYAAKKSQEAQSEASRNAAAGEAGVGEGGMEGFGASGDVLKEMMANSGEPSDVSQFNPGPALAPTPMPALPGLANFAPPQEPITQARTYSEGVDAPNVAPPVGGSTGGEVSLGPSPLLAGSSGSYENIGGPSPLAPGSSGSYEAINAPEWQGPIQGGPAVGDPRLQEYMGMIGPMAGMAGAAMGGGNNRAPGSGGFPARPFQMAPSLANLPPRRRY